MFKVTVHAGHCGVIDDSGFFCLLMNPDPEELMIQDWKALLLDCRRWSRLASSHPLDHFLFPESAAAPSRHLIDEPALFFLIYGVCNKPLLHSCWYNATTFHYPFLDI
jgi:hypothetical protein